MGLGQGQPKVAAGWNVGRLAVANTLVELSGQYGLLSGTHYDMMLLLATTQGGCGGARAAELAVEHLMVRQSVVAAILELLVQPMVGRASDRHGRRPLLVGTALCAAALRLAVVARPCLLSVWLAKFGDAAVRACDSTVCSSLADLADGNESDFSGTRGLVWSMQGAAAGGGPLLGQFLCVAFGGPRAGYFASAVASMGVAIICCGLPETRHHRSAFAAEQAAADPTVAAAVDHDHAAAPTTAATADAQDCSNEDDGDGSGPGLGDRSKLKQVTASAINPFGFLNILLGAGVYSAAPANRGALRRLAAARFLQMLPFYGLYDVVDSFMRVELGMSSGMVARFRSLEGCLEISSGLLVSPSLRCLGRTGHTLLGNTIYAVAYMLMGASGGAAQITACLLLMATCKPDSAIEAAAVYAGVHAGVGEGEICADLEALSG